MLLFIFITNKHIYLFSFIVFHILKDIYCFYIISYINIIYITTVYRSYGTHGNRFWIVIIIEVIRVRVTQVFIIAVDIALVNRCHIEIRIARVHVHRTRSDYPTYMPYKDFPQPAIYFEISSIFSPNLKYFLLFIICLS